jgi:hypothetical protein
MLPIQTGDLAPVLPEVQWVEVVRRDACAFGVYSTQILLGMRDEAGEGCRHE